ncbi:MAG: CoA transferase [Proteobacteria bacterium]|nr:CoA transferase [Pseudomonadota bacterium]
MKDGPLTGIKIIDLSRVLAGPVCTQMLGDLGAEIIKIERPGVGDDTRLWGPPFLKDAQDKATQESAYYLSANRNKKSLTLDLGKQTDLTKLHDLLKDADVLIENFKLGSLEKMGLGYEQLKQKYPRLVYCSITGFGQTGPMASEPGYDFMIQGLSGFMSVTGPAEGPPSKAGVAIIDYVTGQNAAIGILAALRAREETGKGQMVDVALFDSGLAMMTNIASYALTSGKNPPRVGNAHTTIVPYNAFEALDGWVILAVGNDHQFEKFAGFAGAPDWAQDARFKTNSARVTNRDALTKLIAEVIKPKPCAYWIDGLLGVDVPCGPILTMTEALNHPQAKARDMVIEMQHKYGQVKLVGNPIKLSDTPVSYRKAPPINGEDN